MYLMIDSIDRKILLFLQDDLPLESRPYASLAEELAISEDEIIERVKKYIESGLIRRFGAILRHEKAGYSSNAMVVWEIDEEYVDEVADNIAEYDFVSHLYGRKAFPHWNYNLYSMVHARSDDELARNIKILVDCAGGYCKSYRVLRSLREFKKTSMKYFSEE